LLISAAIPDVYLVIIRKSDMLRNSAIRVVELQGEATMSLCGASPAVSLALRCITAEARSIGSLLYRLV
jgi:hypothetical protein